MRILKIDEKNRVLHLLPEVSDDLWHLERVIEQHDIVSGLTDRKVKPKQAGEKPMRVKLFLSLDVDSVQFHRFLGMLRVSGRIVEGKPAELIEVGAQHAIELPLGREVKVKKQAIKKYQLERLRKAAAATKQCKTLLVVLDDEQANFALLREFEFEETGTVRSGKSGKQFKGEDQEAKYFQEVFAKISEAKPEKCIIAGPGFTKENFQRFIEGKQKPAIDLFFASTGSVGKTGLQELLKSDALNKAVEEMQLVRETQLVEGFLAALGKSQGLAEYGLEAVEKAVEVGSVKQLLVADRLLLEKRQDLEALMQKAERLKGEVHLINSEHDAGKQLLGLGGVAAVLRFRIE